MSKIIYRAVYISANSLGNQPDNFGEFEHFDEVVEHIEWYLETINNKLGERCVMHRVGRFDWRAKNGSGFHIMFLLSN